MHISKPSCLTDEQWLAYLSIKLKYGLKKLSEVRQNRLPTAAQSGTIETNKNNLDEKPNWKTINGVRVLIDDDGNVAAGPQGIKQWAGTAKKKGKTKYAPSPQRQKKGIQVSKKKYAKLTGTLNTQYPGLKPEDGYRTIHDANYWYSVTADGYGGMIIHSMVKIK